MKKSVILSNAKDLLFYSLSSVTESRYLALLRMTMGLV